MACSIDARRAPWMLSSLKASMAPTLLPAAWPTPRCGGWSTHCQEAERPSAPHGGMATSRLQPRDPDLPRTPPQSQPHRLWRRPWTPTQALFPAAADWREPPWPEGRPGPKEGPAQTRPSKLGIHVGVCGARQWLHTGDGRSV